MGKKKQDDLIRGTLDMMILRAVINQSLHGYGILERIRLRSSEQLVIEEGSLYPALHRLEKRGYLESFWERSENNRRAKFYTITESGKRHLSERVTAWLDMSKAINSVLLPRACQN